MPGTDDELATALRELVGDELRVVGHHDAESWTVEYMRDDVRDSYETSALDDIADDLVFSEMGSARQEDLYALGSMHATVRLFDDGIVVHVPTEETSGYLVSLEQDAGVMGRAVVDEIRQVVE